MYTNKAVAVVLALIGGSIVGYFGGWPSAVGMVIVQSSMAIGLTDWRS